MAKDQGKRSSIIMPMTFRGLLDIFSPPAPPTHTDASRPGTPPPPPSAPAASSTPPSRLNAAASGSRSASPSPYPAGASPDGTSAGASASITPSTTRSSSLSGPPVTATPPKTLAVGPDQAGGRPRKLSAGSGVSGASGASGASGVSGVSGVCESSACGACGGGGVSRPERELRAWKRRPLDTYIIVKPPASSSKSIPNLQIQLVVKRPRRPFASPSSGASSSSHTDADADADAGDAGLSTEQRRRSGSDSSTWSMVTSASNAATEKRIEPMFNLSVHHVVHSTVVTDAVTDVKVAKFRRQTLDITGVGTIEPLETQRELFRLPTDDPPPPTYAHPTFGLSPLLTVLPALPALHPLHPLSPYASHSPYPSPPALSPDKPFELAPPYRPTMRRSGSNPRSQRSRTRSRGPSSEHGRELDPPPRTARVGYTWTVRKWAPAPRRWAAMVGVTLGKDGDGDEHVVFEWAPPAAAGAGPASSDAESGDNDHEEEAPSAGAAGAAGAAGVAGVAGAAGVTGAAGAAGKKAAGKGTAFAWCCTVRVGSAEPRLLATLAPANHAKALAVLKIPVVLEPVKGRDMAGASGGGVGAGLAGLTGLTGLAGGKTRDGGAAGTVLSEENLKDVICVTGLWVMVREGFGEGLGKKDSHGV